MCPVTEGGIENIRCNPFPCGPQTVLISSLVDQTVIKLSGKPEDWELEGKQVLHGIGIVRSTLLQQSHLYINLSYTSSLQLLLWKGVLWKETQKDAWLLQFALVAFFILFLS